MLTWSAREEVTMEKTQEKYELVPVPADLVVDVMDFIVQKKKTALIGPSNGVRSLAIDWTPDLLKLQYDDSPPSMQALEKHLAAHPGEEFTTEQLADVMGLEHGSQSVAGALGAFGRRIKNRYGMGVFPFTYRFERESEKYVYSMDADTAEIISAF